MHDCKRIVVVGSPGVGKTALTVQLVEKRFIEKHDSTIEDTYTSTLQVDHEPCDLTILDTSGEEAYAELRRKEIKEGQGFLLCFSITDRNSFYNLRRYHADIVRGHAEEFSTPAAVERVRSSTVAHSAAQSVDHAIAVSTGAAHETVSHHHVHMDSLSPTQSNLRLHALSAATPQPQPAVPLAAVLVGMKADLWETRVVEAEEIEALARDLGLPYIEVGARMQTQVQDCFREIVRQCRTLNEPECTCGAKEALAKKQPHEPCGCQHKCAQCHKRRFVHSAETHAFTDEQPAAAQPKACCQIM